MFQRQLDFKEAVEKVLMQNYCNFAGRASRSEYWWFWLATFVASFILTGVGNIISHNVGTTLSCLFSLAMLLPSLGVAVRRLHDINRSGWWLLLCFIPLIGAIILIVWFCKDSEPVPNQYGPVPNLVEK